METDPVSETLFCPFLDKIGTMDIVQNLSFNYTVTSHKLEILA
jgi:hypothetical protein